MNDVSYEGRDLEVLADMPNYYGWIIDMFAPYISGEVVEYGAGCGTISQRLLPFAKRVHLVEPSANLTRELGRRFGEVENVGIFGETLEAYASRAKSETVDTVVLVNVLEHIEDDSGAISQILRTLRSGGHLCVFVPALEVLFSPLDRLLGHFRRYRMPDLVAKVEAGGGEIVLCRYFDLFGVFPWFVLNRLLGFTAFNPALIRVNDFVCVPISRILERWVRVSFGKNLLLIAKKR